MNIRFFFQTVSQRPGALQPETDNNGDLHHEPGGLSDGQTEMSAQDWIMWVSDSALLLRAHYLWEITMTIVWLKIIC